jgi:predicted DNA-binding transcriptional regulator AlpA
VSLPTVGISDFARETGYCEATVRRWIREERLPAPVRVNRQCFRWSADTIRPFIEKIKAGSIPPRPAR